MPVADPTRNCLLNALSAGSRRSLLARSEPTSLGFREVLFRQAEPIRTVHFPLTAVTSLVTQLQDGSAIELSMIGNEGTTGTPVLLGTGAMPVASCFCQVAGDAIAIPAAAFEDEVGKNAELRSVCLRYLAVLLSQVGQAVACSRRHTTIQRCARWLLMTHDRVGKNSFRITHEFLGFMLGARRASVSDALAALNKASAIRSHHGTIEIANRAALEASSCECYAVVRDAIADLRRLGRS